MPEGLQRHQKHWDHLKGGFSMRDCASEGVPQNVEQPQEEASKGLMFKLFHCYSGPWALPGRSRRPAGISKCAPPRFHTFLAVFRTLIKVPLCSPASARGLPLDLSHGRAACLALCWISGWPCAGFQLLQCPFPRAEHSVALRWRQCSLWHW